MDKLQKDVIVFINKNKTCEDVNYNNNNNNNNFVVENSPVL